MVDIHSKAQERTISRSRIEDTYMPNHLLAFILLYYRISTEGDANSREHIDQNDREIKKGQDDHDYWCCLWIGNVFARL